MKSKKGIEGGWRCRRGEGNKNCIHDTMHIYHYTIDMALIFSFGLRKREGSICTLSVSIISGDLGYIHSFEYLEYSGMSPNVCCII